MRFTWTLVCSYLPFSEFLFETSAKVEEKPLLTESVFTGRGIRDTKITLKEIVRNDMMAFEFPPKQSRDKSGASCGKENVL